MRVLGVHGGPHAAAERQSGFPPGRAHDAAAVLVVDGQVVAAVEESRLDRIKHSNKAPLRAVRACLDQAGLALQQVDRLAFVGRESVLDDAFLRARLSDPRSRVPATAREHHQGLLERAFGHRPERERMAYVPHHLAHALSAALPSGFSSCLVVTLDELGDETAGTVSRARGAELETIDRLGYERSLGRYYLAVIEHLGYGLFDEYKVMGLAPYGDPQRFRGLFRESYALKPGGGYLIHWPALARLASVPGLGRRAHEPFAQVHCDVASALQEALEALALHWIYAFAGAGEERLALAGGVALNCHLAGRLRAEGRFREVYVQPASSDAGCALGAALALSPEASPERSRMRHVFLGPEVGGAEAIEGGLRRWAPLVRWRRCADVYRETAALLASGSVVGWVQGRSEFGPRALGHRSILADPRPAANKDRINAMVKLREAYRPFAPAVLAERAEELFQLGGERRGLGFMTFIVPVEPRERARLGATTHVDGSARVQVVEADDNPELHRLLAAFAEASGMPVLLNTSFNNHAEPIVDSLDDAVACYLTTGLDYLVVGEHLVERARPGCPALEELVPALPAHTYLAHRPGEGGFAEIRDNHDPRRSTTVSPAALALLSRADGQRTTRELCADPAGLAGELFELWCARRLAFHPRGART